MDTPELVQHRAGDVAWSVNAADLEHLTPWLASVADMTTVAGAEPIKHSRTRTVTRVHRSDSPPYILKQYRVGSFWDSLKERWLRSAARTEWRLLHRLALLGVPVSRAVAFGRPIDPRDGVRAYVILEEIPDVRSVKAYYVSLGSELDAQYSFAAELGSFIRSFHDAGVVHNDLHGGNILVRAGSGDGGARFVLIDLQRATIGRPPKANRRAMDIAMVVQAFRGDAPDRVATRKALLDAYCSGPPSLNTPLLGLEAIDARIDAIRTTRSASRGRRCLTNSSQYAVVRLKGARVYHRRDYTCDEVLALADLGSPPPDHVVTRTVAGHDGTELQVRIYPKSVRCFRRSHALAEYVAAHVLSQASKGLPCPVSAIEVLRGQRRGTSVFIGQL